MLIERAAAFWATRYGCDVDDARATEIVATILGVIDLLFEWEAKDVVEAPESPPVESRDGEQAA